MGAGAILQGLLNSATAARTGQLQGNEIANQRATSNAIQEIVQQRAAQQAQIEAQLKAAQGQAALGTATWRQHQIETPPKGPAPTLKRNAQGVYVPVDPNTGLDPDGNPVQGYTPPKPPSTDEPFRKLTAAEVMASSADRATQQIQSRMDALNKQAQAQGLPDLSGMPANGAAPLPGEMDMRRQYKVLQGQMQQARQRADKVSAVRDRLAAGAIGFDAGAPATAPSAAPPNATAPKSADLTQQAQDAITQINASGLPPDQKAARVQAVKDRLQKLTGGSE